MLGRRYMRSGLGSLILLVLVALVVFASDGDEDSSRQTGQTAPEPPGQAAARGVPATVTRVVDGDTAEMLIDGREEDVRYIGIDSPESVQPEAPVECFGPQAGELNERLVEGRRVRLVFDSERSDVYGRLLAYVFRGRLFVNAELVRRGYARTLTIAPNDTYAGLLARLERAAGRAGRGLWRACSP